MACCIRHKGHVLRFRIYLESVFGVCLGLGMARPLRVNVSDGWYHCMHRGIECRNLFSDKREYESFVGLLGEAVERFRFRVHAYCLMENHYHAIVQTPDANLSQGMQWLGLSYSSWFNARHNRVGPLFQGRFRSVPVENGQWALELSTYIHLNPLRIQALGLDKRSRRAESLGIMPPPSKEEATARLKKLRVYAWSSYRAYAGYRVGQDWLTSAELLGRCSRCVDERHRTYRNRVQQMLRRGVDESRLEQFREVVGIGGAQFIEQIKGLANGGTRETERRGRLSERVSFEDVVQAIEGYRGAPREEWQDLHGDWGKWMLLWVARQYTGMTLAQLGGAIGGKDYAAVSAGLKFFDQKLRKDKDLKSTHKAIVEYLNLQT